MSNTLFGESVMAIMEEQFRNLRDGDRYYYELDEGLSNEEIIQIRNTRLVDIINRNCNVEFMQANVFLAQQHTTSVSDVAYEPLAISVYPNPNTGNFFVNAPEVDKGPAVIQIRDLLGKLVFEKHIDLLEDSSNFEINVSNSLTPGLYSLFLVRNKKAGAVKIVLE